MRQKQARKARRKRKKERSEVKEVSLMRIKRKMKMKDWREKLAGRKSTKKI